MNNLQVDSHPESKFDALAIRSLIFPRLSPCKKKKIVWPIVFVPDGEALPKKRKKQ